MQTPNHQLHPLYQHVWTTLRQTRRRNRTFAVIGGVVLFVLCGVGLLIQSGPLAMAAATGGISLAWMLERGFLDGDLVAICLRIMYEQRLTRIELAILDAESNRNAATSQVDRSMQRALRLYRSLNHRRLYR